MYTSIILETRKKFSWFQLVVVYAMAIETMHLEVITIQTKHAMVNIPNLVTRSKENSQMDMWPSSNSSIAQTHCIFSIMPSQTRHWNQTQLGYGKWHLNNSSRQFSCKIFQFYVIPILHNVSSFQTSKEISNLHRIIYCWAYLPGCILCKAHTRSAPVAPQMYTNEQHWCTPKLQRSKGQHAKIIVQEYQGV